MSKSKNLPRYISAIAMILVIFPAFFLTRYAGEAGRYVGSVIYMFVAIWGVFEFLTALKFTKATSIITAILAIVPFFILPFGPLKEIYKYDDQDFAINLKKLLTWIPFVYILGISFLPMAYEFRKMKSSGKMFTRQMAIMFSLLIVATFLKTLFITNTTNIATVFFFIGIAIISDTMGFFGGMLFGKKWFKGKKLAPKISPKKTWAGFIVGFFFSFIFAIILGYYGKIWALINVNQWLISVVMAFILSIISPLGDLLFSAIKRQEDIKDFSNLIPGHGGIFDRIDAMSLVTFISSVIFITFT